MKKFLALFLILASTLSLGACSQAVDYALLTTPPWARGDVAFFEKTVYDIARFDSDGNKIATGTVVLHTDELSNATVNGTKQLLLALKTEITVDYGGAEPDRISSYSIFNVSMSAFYSRRTVEYNNPIHYDAGNGVSYTVDSSWNYSYEACYQAFAIGDQVYPSGAKFNNKDGEKTLALSALPYGNVDSEFAFYFIRSLGGLKTDYSTGFSVTNIYDSFVFNKGDSVYTHPMRIAVASTNEFIKVPSALLSATGSATTFKAVDTTDNADKVSCLAVTYSINSRDKGSDILLHYSAPVNDITQLGALVLNDRRVLVRVKSIEQALTGETLYSTEYTLSSYSAEPLV